MEIVELIFQDSKSLARFLLEHHISGAEVNAKGHSLIANLPHDKVKLACREFGAMVHTKIPSFKEDQE